MDYFLMLILAVIIFICGIICTLIIEFYILKKYIENGSEVIESNSIPAYGTAVLPDDIKNNIALSSSNNNSRSIPPQCNENLAINLTLQFLFNELKNAERVRLWLYRKLNNEFKELLTQTTTGRLFDKVQLKDLNLGTQFPTIKGLEVADTVIDKDTGLLESLDLSLDLHYSGNFQLSIDVKMLLGKTAFLSLQVKRLTGRARLQFTRIPYTHWSLSFYSEPILELQVQSHFQGRQLQPQIVSLIIGAIRRAIRRKHTLPRYKVRYKPFFRRLNDEDIDLSEVASTQLTPGTLEVVLVEVTRLNLSLSSSSSSSSTTTTVAATSTMTTTTTTTSSLSTTTTTTTTSSTTSIASDPVTTNTNTTGDLSQIEIYCTVSVDSTPWIYLTQYSGIPYMVLDLIISKSNSHQLGVVFKQEIVPEIGQTCVLVETIVSASPAAIAEMKKGDILIAVDGKKVYSMNQVGKLIKNAAQRRFVIRVERKYIKFDNQDKKLRNETSSKLIDSDVREHSDTDSIDINKSDKNDKNDKNESPAIKLFRRRKSSSVHYDDNNLIATDIIYPSVRRISTISNHSTASSCNTNYSTDENLIPNLRDLYSTTKEKTFASLITFEETKTYQIHSELQYLNIGVWTKNRMADVPSKLIGYINVPVKLILAQCSTSTTGQYLKCHPLLPPDTTPFSTLNSKLQGYSGFDPILCYGDILLSYSWTSANKNQTNTSSNFNVSDSKKSETDDNLKNIPIVGEIAVEKKHHDFIKTHFHRATHCDFCTKKIWLKDAVQCRECGMVCHKKCETRCQNSGNCGGSETITAVGYEVDEIDIGDGPEISLTSCEDNQGLKAIKASSIANTLLGLKKAGSTSNLTLPTSSNGLSSRSLPPSPCSSRKNSLVGGIGINPELLEGTDSTIAAPLLAGDLDDGLMSRAKDTGKFLYQNLPPQERLDKINFMMGKLKAALDAETNSRLELSQSNDSENAKLIAQSDLRVQALSVLMLHYCAGLQYAQEFIQRPKNNH